MTKKECIQLLKESFDSLIQDVKELSDEYFEHPKVEGKWSGGQQLEHLILTNSAILRGFSAPKERLLEKFGTFSRQEMTLNILTEKYTKAAKKIQVKAPPNLIPAIITLPDKSGKIAEFQKCLQDFINVLNNWTETELSKYQLLHPLIGPMSMREMILFIIFHNRHHQKQLK